MTIEERLAKLGIAKPLREVEVKIAHIFLLLEGRLSLEQVTRCVNEVEGFMAPR